jgi:hypothetical protein
MTGITIALPFHEERIDADQKHTMIGAWRSAPTGAMRCLNRSARAALTLDYFHIELEDHDAVFAEGCRSRDFRRRRSQRLRQRRGI